MQAITQLKGRNLPCLIPSHKQTERRLLSVLMSAMEIVPALRNSVLSEAGYGSGNTCQYQSFMEPEFNGLNVPPGRPDGFIVCERGKNIWSALIEAKSESNHIRPEQIAEYAELAAYLTIDAIISISNEHALTSDDLPYSIQNKKLKKRIVIHISWPAIVVKLEGLVSNANLSVTEEKVLTEVITYMNGAGNGVQTFDQMPESWSDFVTQANAPHGLNKNTLGVREVVSAWQQERRDLKLKLMSKFGSGVDLWFDRKSKNDPAIRDRHDVEILVTDYELRACYVFSRSKVDLYVSANLKSCLTRIAVVLRPPEGKRAKGVVTWLLNNLVECQLTSLAIHLDWPREKNDIFTTLGELRANPEIGSQTLKTAPVEIRLSIAVQSVRSFKSRKKVIQELESATFQLVNIVADAKFI